MEIISQNPSQKPTISDLEPAFKKFQKIRWKRTNMFVNLSGMVTRSEANAQIHHTLRLLFVEPFTAEFMAGEFASPLEYHRSIFIYFLLRKMKTDEW